MLYCATIISLLYLISCVNAKWISEIPDAPGRVYSKLFQIPTWISHIQDYDDDAFNATTIFSVVTVFLSTVYTVYFIFWIYYPSHSRNGRSIGPFNTLLLLYLLSTCVATFTFSLMNAGRIWASFGVYHNLFEIALLSHIMLRLNSVKQPRFLLVCFVYLLVTMFIVIIAPWPLDALFFKFQGLSTDFALTIDLGRLYYHNKDKPSTAILVSSDDDEDDRQSSQQGLRWQEISYEKDKLKYSFNAPVHTNIGVVYIASLLHTVGNTLVTFSNHFYLWVIFQFTYAVSFPMFAYYLVAEPNASRVRWYKVDYAKEVLVVLSSFTLAGLCIALGIYNADLHHR